MLIWSFYLNLNCAFVLLLFVVLFREIHLFSANILTRKNLKKIQLKESTNHKENVITSDFGGKIECFW